MAAAVAGIALFSLGAGLAATGVGVAPGALLMALGAGVGFAAPHISRMGEDPLNHAHDDRPAAVPGPGTVPANAVAYPPNHTQNYELPGADH